MKVDDSAIKRYKAVSWFNLKKKKIIFGIDVVMINGAEFHVTDNGKACFFEEKKDAAKEVRKLNKELKVQVSDTTKMSEE